MEREEFFKLIESKGFRKLDTISKYGERTFETESINDGWMDGYDNKYILLFAPTYGIKFTIDKISVGGFCGDQKIEERMFSGVIETEEDFTTLLKLIRFNMGIL